MKKLYLYLIKNTKKINFICLLCCIIPIIAGICLWIWLPDKLICWNTVTASMSGTGSKFEIIFIYPLIMLIIELFIIKLADALINKTVANLTKIFIPLYVLYTSIISLANGMNNLFISLILTVILFIFVLYLSNIYNKFKMVLIKHCFIGTIFYPYIIIISILISLNIYRPIFANIYPINKMGMNF